MPKSKKKGTPFPPHTSAALYGISHTRELVKDMHKKLDETLVELEEEYGNIRAEAVRALDQEERERKQEKQKRKQEQKDIPASIVLLRDHSRREIYDVVLLHPTIYGSSLGYLGVTHDGVWHGVVRGETLHRSKGIKGEDSLKDFLRGLLSTDFILYRWIGIPKEGEADDDFDDDDFYEWTGIPKEGEADDDFDDDDFYENTRSWREMYKTLDEEMEDEMYAGL